MDNTSRAPHISVAKLEEKTLTERRDFIKRAGKVAVTVPTVALLLSISAKSVNAADAFPAISGVQ